MLGYKRESFERVTTISASALAKFDKKGLTFTAHIEPQDRGPQTSTWSRPPAPRRNVRPTEVRARPETGATEHGTEPPTVDRRRPRAGMRLGR